MGLLKLEIKVLKRMNREYVRFKGRKVFRQFALFIVVSVFFVPVVLAERVKDIANVAGVRSNQLVGYGIVVGLNGSGDSTSQAPFTLQSIQNMLSRFGIKIPEDVNPQLKNVAAVTVHASLPPFAKPGQSIDVTVSSMGNASSLHGGSLLMTPLLGADGQVYAMAQGNLMVGGFSAQGGDGSKLTVNIPSAGRIPNGAMIERMAPGGLGKHNFITLNLQKADFTTASRLMAAINQKFGEGSAKALDSSSVVVQAPSAIDAKIAFLSVLENIEIEPGEAAAKVIVNSRTGTVVIGSNVKVMPAAVSHGSLVVTVKEKVSVSQPTAFSEGETTVTTDSSISAEQGGDKMFKFDAYVTLDEIVRAVNQVGAAPSDLVAILEALDRVGALKAQLIVI